LITIKIAEIAIGIDNRYENIVHFAKDYLSDEKPEFTVSVTDEEIEEERVFSETDYTPGYYESIISYRKIAERLPDYDAFLFHGSVIEYKEKAYIITAHSGVGKTTHTRLWMSEFGDEVKILNGDKPTLRIIEGEAYACGTPWQGKENYGRNVIRKIAGFAFLTRGDVNKAYEISPSDAVMRFMSQIYLPKKSKVALIKTMNLADRVLRGVKLVHLECNMNPEAAHVCRDALLLKK
jgi:hypothetical protein